MAGPSVGDGGCWWWGLRAVTGGRRLAGPGFVELGVGDELFLIAHEEQTGRCRVDARVLAVGLAAGLVGELLLSGHLVVRAGGMYVSRAGAAGPVEALGGQVLAAVAGSAPGRDLGLWLGFLALEAVQDVRSRLLRGGVIARGASRAWGRARYLPVDGNTAAWPGIRLARELARREPLPAADALLCGLVDVVGLLGQVLWDPQTRPMGAVHAVAVREALPADLGYLLACAETAIGDLTLSPGGT